MRKYNKITKIRRNLSSQFPTRNQPCTRPHIHNNKIHRHTCTRWLRRSATRMLCGPEKHSLKGQLSSPTFAPSPPNTALIVMSGRLYTVTVCRCLFDSASNDPLGLTAMPAQSGLSLTITRGAAGAISCARACSKTNTVQVEWAERKEFKITGSEQHASLKRRGKRLMKQRAHRIRGGASGSCG